MTYTLAIGPFHPLLRGPQRLLLKIAGEQVREVEYLAGYNERDCAERLTRLTMEPALELVGRICGTCSQAHRLAFCQALEALLGMQVPPRGLYLRVALAELERLQSHLAALQAIGQALGLPLLDRAAGAARVQLREQFRLTGGTINLHCRPGGVDADIADEQRRSALTGLERLGRRLFQLADQLLKQPALLARCVDRGQLNQPVASQFGLAGPMARAAGLPADLRIDAPYAAYAQLPPRLIVQEGGDCYARMVLLLLEAIESCKLAERALQELPEGAVLAELPRRMLAGESSSSVEAPRGPLEYRLSSDGERLTAVRIKAAPQIDRLLARTLLSGALIDDVLPIVLSTDPCPACAEC